MKRTSGVDRLHVDDREGMCSVVTHRSQGIVNATVGGTGQDTVKGSIRRQTYQYLDPGCRGLGEERRRQEGAVKSGVTGRVVEV
jgi:hypothetical protein